MQKSSATCVSVIVPVYKTPLNYFKQCLDSLHSQTLSETEFIVVLDGENNELYSFAKTYAKTDNRFKIYNQPHAGVSATRNYGIKQAKGEYITFVDADDWIEKECCLDVYNFAKETNAEVTLFDYTPTDHQYISQQMFSKPITELSTKTIEDLQKQTIYLTNEKYVAAVSTWCKFFKKDLIDNNHLSFSTNLKICVDRPFSFSAFLFAKKISYLNKFYYNYNKVESSITWSNYKDKTPLILAYLTEIKKISPKFSKIIGRQAMEIFLDSWSTNYFIKKDFDSINNAVKKIQILAKSPNFQWLIEKMDSSKWPYTVKLEAFLIKHKITFHIWLHAYKWKYLSNP